MFLTRCIHRQGILVITRLADDRTYENRFIVNLVSKKAMLSESPIVTGLIVLGITAVHLYAVKTAHKERERRSHQPDGLEPVVIKKFLDRDAVSKELCAFVARAAKEAIAMRGVFHLAVAGGTLLDSLSGLADYRDSVDFSKVVLSFVGQECMDPFCDEATLSQSRTKFTVKAGIKNTVVMSRSPDDNGDGSREATSYAKAMRDAGIPHKSGYPVFDLVVLELGPDGHVGSCYPVGPGVDAFDMTTVTSTRKGGEPSSTTFTLGTINAAREVAIVGWHGTKAIQGAMSGSAKHRHGILSALSRPSVFFVIEETGA